MQEKLQTFVKNILFIFLTKDDAVILGIIFTKDKSQDHNIHTPSNDQVLIKNMGIIIIILSWGSVLSTDH